MEPAIKPAVEATQTGVIGVLTTQTTANGPLYARVLSRYAGNIQVITQVAPQLVRIVEENSADTAHSRQIIAEAVQPFTEAGADHLVLACTHFPFLADAIAASAPKITLIDPASAVARQVTRVWPPALHPASTPNQYFTSGDPDRFSHMLQQLLGIEALALHVSP
jgi:glutamate racemase